MNNSRQNRSYTRCLLSTWYPFAPILVAIYLYFFSGWFELYPRVGWADAGMYVGCAENMGRFLQDYGFVSHNYQCSRLAYLGPWQFFSMIFGPILGRYIFVFFCYSATMIALGVAAKQCLLKIEGRLVFTAFMAFNPALLASLVFGGADGPTMAYIIISGMFFLMAENGKVLNNVWLCLSGLFTGLAFSSHIVSLIPLVIMYTAFFFYRRTGFKEFACIVLTAILTIMIVARIGYDMGMNSFFLSYSYGWIGYSLTKADKMFRVPIDVWIEQISLWLLPLFLVIYVFCRFIRHNWHYERNLDIPAFLLLAGPILFMVLWDVITGGTMCQTFHYYMPIGMPCFIYSSLFIMRDADFSFNLFQAIFLAIIPLFLTIIAALDVSIYTSIMLVVLFLLIFSLITQHDKNLIDGRNRIAFLAILIPFLIIAVSFSHNKIVSAMYTKPDNANTKELMESQVNLISTINSMRFETQLAFIYDGAKAQNESYGKRYRIFFKNHEIVSSYLDSLVSSYMFDRSTLTKNLASQELERNLQLFDRSRPLIILAEDIVKLNQLSGRVSKSGFGYNPSFTLCFESRTYPWCIRGFEYH